VSFGKLASIKTTNPVPVGIYTSADGYENLTVYVNNHNNTAAKYSIGITTDGVSTRYVNRFNSVGPLDVIEEEKLYIDYTETLVVQSTPAGVSFLVMAVGGGSTTGISTQTTLSAQTTDANKGTLITIAQPEVDLAFTLGINNLSYEVGKVSVGLASSQSSSIDNGWIIANQNIVPGGNYTIQDLYVAEEQKLIVKSTVKDTFFELLGVPAASGGGGGGPTGLDSELGVGNTSSLGMQVGLSTFPGVVVGGSTTALMVSGNARITGVTTFGTGSITINKSPDYIEGVNVLTAGRVNATNKFVGNLEGNVTGNVTGVATGAEKLVGSPGIIGTTITATTKFVGNLEGNVTQTSGTAQFNTINTVNLVATSGTVTGNLSVGGTLTYEDVTNIDSVGLITARTGIEISGIVTARPGFAVTYYGDGDKLSGVTTGVTVALDNYGGISPFVQTGTKNVTVTIGSTSNAYGVYYVSAASTPGGNAIGNNGDIWYFTG
jgi:hypothetical protein|tara:strand:+ start:253 stop:1725 length:1473 start_codon:yes stop_codon:yes gene_type:complete